MNKIMSFENIYPFSPFLAGKKNQQGGKNESYAEYTPLNS